MKALAIVAFCAGTASAKPSCDTGFGKLSLFNAKGAPVACWSDSECVAVDAKHASVAHPQVAKETTVTRDKACAGSTCKAVGKKLSAAIAGATTVTATTDLAVVVVENGGDRHLWNLAADAEVTLTPPRSYGPDATPGLMRLDVVGTTLVANWSDCAGPCIKGQLVTADGKNVGDSFDAGGTVAAIDGARLVVGGELGEISIVDRGTGKVLGTVTTTLREPVVVGLSSTSVYAVGTTSATRNAWVAQPIELDAKGKPKLGKSLAVPGCDG